MNVEIDNQLDLFELIKQAIFTDSILKSKFKNKVFEFEPKLKDIDNKGLPYLTIEIPSTNLSNTTLKGESKDTSYLSEINLVMDYHIARTGKMRDYLTRVLKSIESNKDIFKANGYSELNIKVESVNPEYLPSEREVVRATLVLECKGVIETQ